MTVGLLSGHAKNTREKNMLRIVYLFHGNHLPHPLIDRNLLNGEQPKDSETNFNPGR